jgi:rRNA maturation RNase YbeY
MIKIYIKKQSNYPVDTYQLKGKLKKFLEGKGIVSDSKLTVAIVGETKMRELSKKYLNDNEPHSVLSFVANEVSEDFRVPPDKYIDLGDIVVCYSIAVDEAKRDQMLVDDKVYELIEHGVLHLLGEHHE